MRYLGKSNQQWLWALNYEVQSDLEQSIHLGVTTFIERKKLRQKEAQEKERFQTHKKKASAQQLLPGLCKHLGAQPC